MQHEPLILTLELDAASFQFFDALRRQHFPPERNFLAAHLTLFHHLPPTEPAVIDDVARAAASTQVIELLVAGVVMTGRGVAFKLESSPLQQLHRQLQEAWKPWLLPQDRQGLWPHVTVQNKVAPSTAKELHTVLADRFSPFEAKGSALLLWIYKGGPWQALERYPLQPSGAGV